MEVDILQPLAHIADKRQTRDQEVAGSSITHFAVGVPPWASRARKKWRTQGEGLRVQTLY